MGLKMIVRQDVGPAMSEVESRQKELKAERMAGFRDGALAVFTVALMIGAFWYGVQAGPTL